MGTTLRRICDEVDQCCDQLLNRLSKLDIDTAAKRRSALHSHPRVSRRTCTAIIATRELAAGGMPHYHQLLELWEILQEEML